MDSYKSKFALPSANEFGAVRLIRTACSAFQKRGHQAAGQSEDFAAYLDELAVNLHLVKMEGNRFNVIFHNGAAVYFHISHFLSYIEGKHDKNRLLLAVQEDCKNIVDLCRGKGSWADIKISHRTLFQNCWKYRCSAGFKSPLAAVANVSKKADKRCITTVRW